MGFEELLQKRLGPMKGLVDRRRRPDAPKYDPADLTYRRALGVEVRARPEDTWAQVELTGVRGDWQRLDMRNAAKILGLTDWRDPSELGIKPDRLWRWVSDDLLYYSLERPDVALTGGVLALGDAPIARRAAMHVTVAVEDSVAVKPMPFMPRGRDLVGAGMVGVRFAGRERGVEVLGLTITGGPTTGEMMRDLLPLLDGRHTPAQIVERLPRSRPWLELLASMTVLEVGEAQDALLAPEQAQVTWLGHAGVLVQAHGKSLLVDPVFFADSDPPERNASCGRFDPRALPPIDAVLITHGDNDHLNPNSLVHLPRQTPIIVPRPAERPAPYQVDLRGLLDILKFDRVVELDPWSSVKIGDVEVMACPFAGECWDLDLPQATFLVESRDLSAFFAADSAAMPDTFRALAERPRRVDIAFMGVGGCAEAFAAPREFGYGNFYEEWIPRTRYNEWVQHCADPKDSFEALAIFAPKCAFGYAAGGASFIETSYSDRGTHAELAELLRASEVDTRPIELEIGRPMTIGEINRATTVARDL